MSEEEENPNAHWVESLFPPAYGVTLNEVLEGRMPDDEEHESRRVQRVSAYNPEAIQNVYEKVRMTMALGKEIKKQNQQSSKGTRDVSQSSNNRSPEQGTTDRMEKHVDLSHSCIWDTEEISVLRKVYKAAKEEITQLKVRIHEIEDRNKKLEQRAVTLETQLQDKTSKHTEAKKANRRLKIHCDTLQEEVGKATAKVKMLHEMYEEAKKERARYMMEAHEARVDLDKERLKRKALQVQFSSQNQKFAVDKVLAEENIRLSYEQEMANLQKRLETVSTDLECERNQHSVTKKGLEQLQKHFSSLPYQAGGFPNAVSKDEIKRFQY
ncbi:coiled-coil domain-containing protein 160 homolog isoform X2 [Liolophura sinensis]